MVADRAMGKIDEDHRAGIISIMFSFMELPGHRKPYNFAS
jgi:hypothetical protein